MELTVINVGNLFTMVQLWFVNFDSERSLFKGTLTAQRSALHIVQLRLYFMSIYQWYTYFLVVTN
jgi:hypothetical protein